MKHLEDSLQAQCILWFDIQYPKFKKLLFHIPNGGKRNLLEAARFKKMGVRAGVADLFFSKPKNKNGVLYHGTYFEFKIGKNSLTPAQQEFKKLVTEQGYDFVLVKSFEEFVKEFYDNNQRLQAL